MLGVKKNLYRVEVLRWDYVLVDAADENEAKEHALRCDGVLQIDKHKEVTLVEERLTK